MADQPALVAEQQRLVARGAALAADVARTAARARDIERTTTAAAAELVATLSDLTRLTSASRAASAAARHDALVAAGELPAEDGSIGSRLRGVVTGLWSDVTDPIDLIVGLGGGHGDPLGHWRSLGAGLVDELTHPWQTVKDLLDASDLRQHDWGQWSGTVVPDGLLSAGSGGLFAVAKVLHGADMMVVARRTVDGLSRAAELDRLARTEALLAAVEGRASALVPVGGLRWHEQAGGHVLDRHVAMSVGALQHRLATEDIGAASTFANRLEAEVAISVPCSASPPRSPAGSAVARWSGPSSPTSAARSA
jgi:hypothetical protein